MLTAYFDETNISPNQRVPMVAGYLASTFQWRRFSEQWDKLLRRANVPVDPKYGKRLVHRINCNIFKVSSRTGKKVIVMNFLLKHTA
jgi:hypothetical protein